MAPEKFSALLSNVAAVIWGSDETRSQNWTSQVEFLRSSEGEEYIPETPGKHECVSRIAVIGTVFALNHPSADCRFGL